MSTIRKLLECLGQPSLMRLMRERGLPSTRRNDERQTSLARSHRGDVEALVQDLNRGELKEGLFAGLAIALAMLSAATRRPVQRCVAVTGELSVHGNVNAVGGVSEKLSAAARHGRQLVVIPAANASELGRLTEIASSLDIRSVRSLKEAVELVLVHRQARRFAG